MVDKQITLRCDDGQEAVVFTQYIFSEDDINYEINVEDSYQGHIYSGLLGRFRRAWAAFRAKPVIYTGIFTEDPIKMKNFLTDCLKLMTEKK